MYKYILLDLDDTLIDYDYSTKYAFDQMIRKFDIKKYTYDDFKLFESIYWQSIPYSKFLDNSNEPLEKIMQLGVEMIEKFLKIDNVLAYKIYLYYESLLGEKVLKTENYDEEIKLLSKISKMIISTNGNKNQAIKKIKKINLQHLILDIISPQDSGFSKSFLEYYDYIFKKFNIVNKNEVLIIGDSLLSDIKSGNLYGIDTCWYNKKNKINDTEYIPTYEIKSFKELVKKI